MPYWFLSLAVKRPTDGFSFAINDFFFPFIIFVCIFISNSVIQRNIGHLMSKH